MKDPRRVRVSGPLAAYRDGFAAELAGRGYTPGSAQRQVGLLAHLSRWLDSRGLGAADLTAARVEEFLAARRADGYTRELSGRGIAPLLGYLRGLGVVPASPQPAACPASELLVQDYRRYLMRERGLAESTVGCLPGNGPVVLVPARSPAGRPRPGAPDSRPGDGLRRPAVWPAPGRGGQGPGHGAAVAAAVLVPGRLHVPRAGGGGSRPGRLCWRGPAPGPGRGGGGGAARQL